jgi:hypothetical protein
MMRCLKFLLLTFFASHANAESVRVASGEHDGFTRFVLYFDSAPQWTAGVIDIGYGIMFDTPDIIFDLSRAFERIPRSRVSDLVFDEGEGILKFNSACDCRLDVFELSEEILVVDVKSGKPSRSDKYSEPLSKVSQETKIKFPELLSKPALSTSSFQPKHVENVRREANGELGLGSLETSLLEQLGRASSQGLLALKVPDSSVQASESSSMVTLGDDLQNLSISNAIDRELAADSLENQRPNCISEPEIAVWNWGELTGMDGIFSLRSQLSIGAVDGADFNEETAIELAKNYIHLGFGAEASDLLRTLPGGATENKILIDLAHIMDDLTHDTESVFFGMEGCDGPSALWATLLQSGATQPSYVDAVAVQRNFYLLPSELRQHLGPRLAEQLKNFGYEEESKAIAESLIGSRFERNDALVRLQAIDAISTGQLDEADMLLKSVIAADSPEAHSAMVSLLELAIVRNQPVTENTLLLAKGMLRELKDSPLEMELISRISDNYILSDSFDSAFDFLSGYASNQVSEEYDKLVAEFVLGASDVQFVKQSFYQKIVENHSRLSTDTRNLFLERLLQLGFSDEVKKIIDFSVGDESDLFQARVALMAGDASSALRRVSGIDDPSAGLVRGQALSHLENFEAAAQTFLSFGAEGEAAKAAWQSGNWELIEQFGTDDQRDLLLSLNLSGAQPLNLLPIDGASSDTTQVTPLDGQDLKSGLIVEGQSLVRASAKARSSVLGLLENDD